MKVMFMAIVMVVVGLGYFFKTVRYADDVVEAAPIAVRGAVSALPAMTQSARQTKSGPSSIPSAQMEIINKAIETGEIKPYATPELQKLLWDAEAVLDGRADGEEIRLGCDFFESYYMGHDQGGGTRILAWEVNTLPNGAIRVTYSRGFDGWQQNNLIDFVMKGNWIDDVRVASGFDADYPTKPEHSIRVEAQKIVNGQNCLGQE